MEPFDHEAYWRSTWRTPSARLARAIDRERIAARAEIALRRHGAPLAYEVFGRRFLLCAPALPGVRGDPDLCLILSDAAGDLFLVAQRERAATKQVAIHELSATALIDFLARATGAARDLDAIACWIWGADDDAPPDWIATYARR